MVGFQLHRRWVPSGRSVSMSDGAPEMPCPSGVSMLNDTGPAGIKRTNRVLNSSRVDENYLTLKSSLDRF